ERSRLWRHDLIDIRDTYSFWIRQSALHL
ncbi:hypothetical protein COK19_21755, partial [Bacillus cereus]